PAAPGHEVGNGLTITSSFQNEVANERDTLRIVELYAAREPRARHQRSHRDQELVSLARRKIHAAAFSMTTSSAHQHATARAVCATRTSRCRSTPGQGER